MTFFADFCSCAAFGATSSFGASFFDVDDDDDPSVVAPSPLLTFFADFCPCAAFAATSSFGAAASDPPSPTSPSIAPFLFFFLEDFGASFAATSAFSSSASSFAPVLTLLDDLGVFFVPASAVVAPTASSPSSVDRPFISFLDDF